MKGEFEKRIDQETYIHSFQKCGDMCIMVCSDTAKVRPPKNAIDKDVVKFEDVKTIIDNARKEFHALIDCDPMDWIYHTGKKKQAIEKTIKKWFGDADE